MGLQARNDACSRDGRGGGGGCSGGGGDGGHGVHRLPRTLPYIVHTCPPPPFSAYLSHERPLGCVSVVQIPEDMQSPDKWSAAVLELREVDAQISPIKKLRALLNSAKAVYNTHAIQQHMRLTLPDSPAAQLQGNKASVMAMSADDYLPIHIYVVIQSRTSHRRSQHAMVYDCLPAPPGHTLSTSAIRPHPLRIV